METSMITASRRGLIDEDLFDTETSVKPPRLLTPNEYGRQ